MYTDDRLDGLMFDYVSGRTTLRFREHLDTGFWPDKYAPEWSEIDVQAIADRIRAVFPVEADALLERLERLAERVTAEVALGLLNKVLRRVT